MSEASIPDLFAVKERSSSQYTKILPEKSKSFLGFAPTSMNWCLQSNHDSIFSCFVNRALTFTPAFRATGLPR